MLKNLSQLEFTVDGKSCRFQCDCDTPLQIVKEALFQFQNYIGKVEESIKVQQAAHQEELKAQIEIDKTASQHVEEPKPAEA